MGTAPPAGSVLQKKIIGVYMPDNNAVEPKIIVNLMSPS